MHQAACKHLLACVLLHFGQETRLPACTCCCLLPVCSYVHDHLADPEETATCGCNLRLVAFLVCHTSGAWQQAGSQLHSMLLAESPGSTCWHALCCTLDEQLDVLHDVAVLLSAAMFMTTWQILRRRQAPSPSGLSSCTTPHIWTAQPYAHDSTASPQRWHPLLMLITPQQAPAVRG
jgi:hypothetical protein